MAGTGKPRGEYAKTAERRQAILRAGVDVFASGGYRSGSIREIADRVGISQAGLLHHFSSKDELLRAVLDHRDEQATERMGGELPAGLDFIRALADLVEFNESTPGLVALFCVLSAEATAPDHPVHDYFVERYRNVGTWTLDAFALAKQHGELRDDVDPASAARTMIALMDGLQIQWLLRPDSVSMGAEVRRYVQSLLTVAL